MLSVIMYYAVFALLSLWVLWVLYVAGMWIDKVSKEATLEWQAKLLILPTAFVLAAVEIVVNVFVCTFLFVDLPKEITVTKRLRRYFYQSPPDYTRLGKWRMFLVRFLKPMLDPFDHKGPHI
jgi:hypothetical protein